MDGENPLMIVRTHIQSGVTMETIGRYLDQSVMQTGRFIGYANRQANDVTSEALKKTGSILNSLGNTIKS